MKSRRLPTCPPLVRMWRVSPRWADRRASSSDTSMRMPYKMTSWRMRSMASWRDRAEFEPWLARPSASCMRSMAFCWKAATTCGIKGVMRLTMASIASMRDTSTASSAAPSRLRLSTKAATVRLVSAPTSACKDSCPTCASSMMPGQRSSSATVMTGAETKCWPTSFCRRASSASRGRFSACVPAVAALRPKLRRTSTLPRVMADMTAARRSGSSARRSSLMRNCRSRKRELTLLISIVSVPAAPSLVATA